MSGGCVGYFGGGSGGGGVTPVPRFDLEQDQPVHHLRAEGEREVGREREGEREREREIERERQDRGR